VTPLFSVIVPTYNRGTHIRPTILSALGQTFWDYEIIVVTDGCSDGTLDTVRSIGSPQISTYELPANSGSQSAPNNLGIERARGTYIAYLGHDDVWHPEHLAEIARTFSANPSADVVASGCIFHGPKGSGISFVTGLLDGEHPASEHFLPPSALAHKRDLIDRIGPWVHPEEVVAPVDCEIMLRAFDAGAQFASTGTVTVHKFAAGHRYLSYLRPSSAEQEVMLSGLRSFPSTSQWSFLIDAAKRQDRYMIMKHDFDRFRKGEIYHQNRSNKGLARPALRRLTGRAVLSQTDEPRGLDWHQLEAANESFRWSGPSTHPQFLIPFEGTGAARLVLHVLDGTPDDVVDALSFDCDGRSIPHVRDDSTPGLTKLALEISLRPGDYSVLGITTARMFRPADGVDGRLLGIALGDVEIEPRPRN